MVLIATNTTVHVRVISMATKLVGYMITRSDTPLSHHDRKTYFTPWKRGENERVQNVVPVSHFRAEIWLNT